jgi:hypothetical protein
VQGSLRFGSCVAGQDEAWTSAFAHLGVVRAAGIEAAARKMRGWWL